MTLEEIQDRVQAFAVELMRDLTVPGTTDVRNEDAAKVAAVFGAVATGLYFTIGGHELVAHTFYTVADEHAAKVQQQ